MGKCAYTVCLRDKTRDDVLHLIVNLKEAPARHHLMIGQRGGILMKIKSPPRRVCWISLGDRDEIREIKEPTWTRCLGTSEE